jgi:DNA-binding NtrC family response regulator
MESLIAEMLDGRILLDEAMTEFEKIYIQTALARNSDHLCNTATALGIHRNTLSKRVASYNGKPTAKVKPSAKKKLTAKKKRASPAARAKSRRK